MIKKKLFFLLVFLTTHFVTAQTTQSGVSVSPYVITIQQPDGSSLRIIGKVEQIPYTETEDGYTILKNDRNLYEYAIKASGGKLMLSGFKAKDAAKRSSKDKKFLYAIPKHLRYESPYLETILKEIGNQPYNQ